MGRHYATPTPFVGGVNNTTYYPRWIHQYWNRIYGSIMAPGRQVIQIAEADGYDMFVQWAKLFKFLEHLDLFIMAQLFTLITGLKGALYDSEESLYNTWFSELDQIVSTFSANTSYSGFSDFDATYNGSIPHWIKMANSQDLDWE